MEIAHHPKWETWLNFPFYEEKCTIHPKKYNTIYCGACKERPVCTRCWKSNQHHAHHQPVLRVHVASHRAAIDVKDIREFLDISEIQVYKINYKNIVFLNPHGQVASKEDPKNPRWLMTCSRKLMNSDDDNHYKFCCIACKIGSKKGDTKKIEEEMIVRERPRIILKLKLKSKRKNEECSSSSSSLLPSLSLRKRSRKGIPHRAPLQ